MDIYGIEEVRDLLMKSLLYIHGCLPCCWLVLWVMSGLYGEAVYILHWSCGYFNSPRLVPLSSFMYSVYLSSTSVNM